MQDHSNVMTWLSVAALAATSIALLMIFATPRVTKEGSGKILSKTFVPSTTYNPPAQGSNRGFQTQAPITKVAYYRLEIDAGELGKITAGVSEITAKTLNVGDRVSFKYEVRGFLGIWKKVYVSEVAKTP
jgi:hypothetical protein